jgi:regulator of cell morphogenesis and NO signaling
MSEAIDLHASVRAIVVHHPQTRSVLEKLGIDYCCGGDRSLHDAAAAAGVSADEALATIREAAQRPAASEGCRDWTDASLTDLVGHIERKHHTFMKEQLPRLDALADKVGEAHQAAHGDMLDQVQEVFRSLKSEIEEHLFKEEQILFPLIRQMEAFATGEGPEPVNHCGTVENPIRQMRSEHDNAGAALTRMRELTHSYTLPDDACASFTALYDGLKALEADLHEHIHLENNILFPGAVALEETNAAGHSD